MSTKKNKTISKDYLVQLEAAVKNALQMLDEAKAEYMKSKTLTWDELAQRFNVPVLSMKAIMNKAPWLFKEMWLYAYASKYFFTPWDGDCWVVSRLKGNCIVAVGQENIGLNNAAMFPTKKDAEEAVEKYLDFLEPDEF